MKNILCLQALVNLKGEFNNLQHFHIFKRGLLFGAWTFVKFYNLNLKQFFSLTCSTVQLKSKIENILIQISDTKLNSNSPRVIVLQTCPPTDWLTSHWQKVQTIMPKNFINFSLLDVSLWIYFSVCGLDNLWWWWKWLETGKMEEVFLILSHR